MLSSSPVSPDGPLPSATADSLFLQQQEMSRKVAGAGREEGGDQLYRRKMFGLVDSLKQAGLEEELKIDSDGTVTAGTLPALIERLTTEPLAPTRETVFRNVFLMTMRTFSTPEAIFTMLVDRFYVEPRAHYDSKDVELWKLKTLYPTQKRILEIFNSWLDGHRLIDDSQPLARRLQELLNEVESKHEATGIKLTAKKVMKTLERITFTVPGSAPCTSPPQQRRKRSKSSKGDLAKMDASEFAQHLCSYEHRLYMNIHPKDCLDYIKPSSRDQATSLAEFCSTHDKLGTWVKLSILQTEKTIKRSDLVEFWIKVAEKCRALHNFSSLSAIVTALSSTVISRLHLTWAHVSRERLNQLETLTQFNEPAGNFASYRMLQEAIQGPCVPFVTMYLTDLLHINDQYHDTLMSPSHASSSPMLINFLKRHKWFDVVSTMLQHQRNQYGYVEDPATQGFIELNLAQSPEADQSAFWARSQFLQHEEVTHADIQVGLRAAGF